jgi:hypothetical protein
VKREGRVSDSVRGRYVAVSLMREPFCWGVACDWDGSGREWLPLPFLDLKVVAPLVFDMSWFSFEDVAWGARCL